MLILPSLLPIQIYQLITSNLVENITINLKENSSRVSISTFDPLWKIFEIFFIWSPSATLWLSYMQKSSVLHSLWPGKERFVVAVNAWKLFLVAVTDVENPDETLRHVLAHNSGRDWSFSKIPSQAGQWELCQPGRAIFERFRVLWRFLWVEKGEKKQLFGLFVPLRSAPRPPILA